MNINIAIVGPVSAGKSTLMNTLFINKFSEMKIKRTTMQPQIYIETYNNIISDDILLKNTNCNKNYYNEKNIKIEPIYHNVNKIRDFVELNKNISFVIHDLPGLNDSSTDKEYFNYINNNFNLYDIIFFVIDINSSLNTSDEIKILDTILRNIREQKDKFNKEILLYVIANKYDNENEEYNEMIEQANKIISEKIKLMELENFTAKLIPMSLETAYIYRMNKYNPSKNLDLKYIDRIGNDNFGKREWKKMNETEKNSKIKTFIKDNDFNDMMEECKFTKFKNILQKDLSTAKQYIIVSNKQTRELIELLDSTKKDYIMNILKKIKDILLKIINTNKLIFCSHNIINEKYFMFYVTKIMEIINRDILQIADNYTNYELYNLILEISSLLKSNEIFLSLASKIAEKAIDYYEDKIKNHELLIDSALEYVENIKKYTGDDPAKYYQNILTKNNNVYNLSANKIVELNKKIHIICPTIKMIDVLFSQLGCIYKCIYKTTPIKYFDNVDVASYIFQANDFWNCIVNKHDLFFSKKIPKLQNLRFHLYKSYVLSSINNTDKLIDMNLDLELYLTDCLKLIKK